MTTDTNSPRNEQQASAKDSPNSGVVITMLATLPGDTLLDVKALAGILGKCPKSVERSARRGEFPPGFRFGRKYVWQVKRIREHFDKLQDKALRQARMREQSNS